MSQRVQQPPLPQQPFAPRQSYRPALRVATAIAVIKWILMVLEIIAVLISAGIAVVIGLDGSDYWVPYALGALGGLIIICLTWVLFGWFEQVLRTLVGIAENTRRP